ncbi:hypothetical protein F2Q70_00036994 [Brassica cretica]|uniref:Uncharacterized protein n=1 Tax=Brassica cretica TaxID=69181 RepID=A0A8S9JVK9_BRACR|nr:hypothetical protein F2Q70_00036994 [Brassica cretica]
MSMRSAKSFGKSYVTVYFTNISPGTAESELGSGKQKWLRTTRNLPHQYFSPVLRAETGVRFCILLSLTWMGGETLNTLLLQKAAFESISIMAAGTGSTALFTVICSFASRRVPFCANKFFKTVLGFSLVILLWAVDRLGRLWLLSWQQEQE